MAEKALLNTALRVDTPVKTGCHVLHCSCSVCRHIAEEGLLDTSTALCAICFHSSRLQSSNYLSQPAEGVLPAAVCQTMREKIVVDLCAPVKTSRHQFGFLPLVVSLLLVTGWTPLRRGGIKGVSHDAMRSAYYIL